MTTRSLVERAGTFFGLVLVAIIFGALVGPQFFAPTNLELMARQMAIVSIAAVGMTIVIVVATAVTRNHFVQPSRRLPASNPNTTKPVKIATRLIRV